jgi:hypothetical protein
VVLRAMHRDPTQRFPSVRALGQSLLAWAPEPLRSEIARELGSEARTQRRAPRWRVWAAATALALGVAALSLRAVTAGDSNHTLARSRAAASTAGPATSPSDPASTRVQPQASEPHPSAASPVAEDPHVVPSRPPPEPSSRPSASAPTRAGMTSPVASEPRTGSSPPRRAAQDPLAPERGTNGAFIVE